MHNDKAAAAEKSELDGLYAQGVFEEVDEKYIPPEAVVLPSRMVFDIKNEGTEGEKYRARITAGGP